MLPEACPLCRKTDPRFYHRDRSREYLRCERCKLVYVPAAWHLPAAEEKALYDQHRNSPDDQDYRKFLSRLTKPLLERLGRNGVFGPGLDFGCGPGPALAEMLNESGCDVVSYDPFYLNELQVLDKKYQFITATEVVEHFRQPEKEFRLLFSMLESGGWLGIMTKMVIDQQAFSRWHYIRDLSHISFFCRETFFYLGECFGARPYFEANDVILMQKNNLLSAHHPWELVRE